ncbi:ribosomal-protein-alanine N-acetyltransferase [Ruminiclostridium hungatei]|uniref:[Ribosomal protein bS18]-alanine N-acetyltransferase n=1 Tax=Ruminiclostridium hungatei TaxID=48256 RepID=A0A1V4SGF1_RUMHU|nr:ribosomal protein S18-alanine N-acetyltransferase [Ruminiclostridium hungatei]OPX42948.1 ribosomal-protein-alanine N-acetyltransferase [Ruminiclostridium hungatei]
MVDNIEVVRMTQEHLDGVMTIENLSFKIPWSRNAFIDEMTTNDMAVYVVAVSGKKIIGYGGLWRILDEGHITNIAVHPEFRRCGAGCRIMDELLKLCRENGILSLTLEVRRGNLPAQKLYEKYGFRSEGIRKGYYSDTGEDAIIMWKHLDR